MLFGSSGIRQKFSQDLVEISLRAGAALSGNVHDIIIGTDTRTTSGILANAFISGCISNGAKVKSCGIVPTPVVAFNTRNAEAGCMVTASHNPEQFNGLKMFNPDGSSFTRSQQLMFESEIKSIKTGEWLQQGVNTQFDAIPSYKSAILEKVSVDKKIRVLLDCGSGAGTTVSPDLLTSLGVEVVCINCHPSGHFPRPSEPISENLPYISHLMVKTNVKVAVVHDGDADRMMAFDEKGRYIDGDRLLMLFASYLGIKKVVTTVDASMTIEEIAEVRRTPVGDSFVSEELIHWGEFGGEPSGAWIFPSHSLCPDGPYAGALFCQIASEWNIADTLDHMPKYPLFRESVHCPDPQKIMHKAGADNPTDGIRLTFEDGWCLIRASGTEPKIRFTAEGKTVEKAREMLSRGRELVREGKTA
jgi:phosphoglucosamine mutase